MWGEGEYLGNPRWAQGGMIEVTFRLQSEVITENSSTVRHKDTNKPHPLIKLLSLSHSLTLSLSLSLSAQTHTCQGGSTRNTGAEREFQWCPVAPTTLP
jgi:hypothetical protein